RADAEAAQANYEAALTAARAKANALAEETRQKLNAEIAKAKADADAKAHDAMAAADARIASTRESAKAAVTAAARDAAIAIVERLTGDKVSAEDAAKALGNPALGNEDGTAARARILGCYRLCAGDRASVVDGRAGNGRQNAGPAPRRHRRRAGRGQAVTPP